jgi:hypothetical protein
MGLIKIRDEWYFDVNHISTVEHLQNENVGAGWVAVLTMVNGKSYSFSYETKEEIENLVKEIDIKKSWR